MIESLQHFALVPEAGGYAWWDMPSPDFLERGHNNYDNGGITFQDGHKNQSDIDPHP